MIPERRAARAVPPPLVTVLIPCRNEARFIEACLESIVAARWPHELLEVLVVDGESDDGTAEVVQRMATRAPMIRLLRNPKRIVPSALNLGIAAARGSVIVRMDAHCVYPTDYIPVLVDGLFAYGADNVGGVCDTVAPVNTAVAKGIALALTHPLAVGNAYFRIGVRQPTWVDTVPFGCYRREVFDRIGTFDEELVRNQDDEFNHRLLKSGGRILLLPSVVITYFARATYWKLASMMYQYGLFKPLCARKVGRVTTVRQLVPSVFVLSVLVSLAGAPFSTVSRAALAGILGLYAAALAVFAVRSVSRHGLAAAACGAAAIPVIHVSYGLGYLRGLGRQAVTAMFGAGPTREFSPNR